MGNAFSALLPCKRLQQQQHTLIDPALALYQVHSVAASLLDDSGRCTTLPLEKGLLSLCHQITLLTVGACRRLAGTGAIVSPHSTARLVSTPRPVLHAI